MKQLTLIARNAEVIPNTDNTFKVNFTINNKDIDNMLKDLGCERILDTISTEDLLEYILNNFSKDEMVNLFEQNTII